MGREREAGDTKISTPAIIDSQRSMIGLASRHSRLLEVVGHRASSQLYRPRPQRSLHPSVVARAPFVPHSPALSL
eukprot:2803855-Pleurochrysis_carterae.AAC.1